METERLILDSITESDKTVGRSGMYIVNAEANQAEKIVDISIRAFETDVNVGGVKGDCPPGFDSIEWHQQMARDGHLYQAMIVRILEVYDDREQLEQFFSARQKELEALSQDTAHKLTLLDAARKRLRKEENMSYNVTLKIIPERYAATVHMTIPRYEDEGMIWGKLAEETCRMNLVADDPCLCAVTYLDGEYKEENVEIMAWKTVKGSYPDTEHVKFRTLPEVMVASCTYQGSYAQITDVYAAVIAWMEANRYEPAEPMFNIYHVSPHETQNPDEFVTEICYPVKKK